MKMTPHQSTVYNYMLTKQHVTVAEVSANTGIKKSSVWRAIYSLKVHHKKVRVCGYVKGGINVIRLYAIGIEPDAVYPYDPSRVLDYLEKFGSATNNELTKHFGWNQSLTRRITNKLLSDKKIYISGYDLHIGTKGDIGKIFSLGNRRNAIRPKADPLENQRRYRAKFRARLVLRSRWFNGNDVNMWSPLTIRQK